MFSRRLHPTPSGFVRGLALVALWALIWIWFFAQLSRPHPAGGHVAVAVHARVSADGSASAATA